MEQKRNRNNTQRNTKETRNTHNSKRKTKAPLRKKIGWGFLISFLIFSIIVLICLIVLYVTHGKELIQYQKEAKQLVSNSTLDTFRQAETSLIYDNNGKLITTVKGEKDLYYLDFDDIPQNAINAMIAIEDKKFLTHEGVDGQAIIRAALALVKNKGNITQGASTITQQLARNIFLSNEVSFERKLKEMFVAIALDSKYSKEQIMEFYLNNIYFANGYYGIEAASKGYFNKKANDLSLSEIAFLCAVPNNPTIYDPLTNEDNTIKRRDRILKQMYEDKMISEVEYEAALSENIKLNQKKLTKNNYIDTFVLYSATRALMENSGFQFRYTFENEADRLQYEEEYNELYNQFQKSLYYEGYQIYTSIDMDKQQLLQTTVDNSLAEYQEKNKEGIYTLQSGAVSIDNETGNVVAIVGGRYQDTTGYPLNRGYQSYRQPGSAIKPLIVYTPSFERGYYPDDIVVDGPIKDSPFTSKGSYSGNITLRRAIELSKNTIAWKLYSELTPAVGLEYLLKMNFAKIDENDYYPATSLGGFTVGVSPLEMTAAYATLEHDGMYREPTCIVKILDSEGNEIVGKSSAQKRIYDINAARIMTNTLTGVLKNGTGKGLGLNNMSAAGKTGTTNDNKDGWFVGYTPYYTTGVWVGYDIPKTLGNLYGATLPGSIWKTYMSEIHKGLENIEFASYEDDRTNKETQNNTTDLDENADENANQGTDETENTTDITNLIEDIEQNNENTDDGSEDQAEDDNDNENDSDDQSGNNDSTDNQNEDAYPGDNSQENYDDWAEPISQDDIGNNNTDEESESSEEETSGQEETTAQN